MEQKEKEKLLKEITDIEHEQKYILKLLAENSIPKLNEYLEGELTDKHRAEKAILNALSTSRPSNTQESAKNALNLLGFLKREKEAKLTHEISDSDN